MTIFLKQLFTTYLTYMIINLQFNLQEDPNIAELLIDILTHFTF